jgi:hypothetical protein
LKTKFHEFVALAADVWCWEVGFCLTIGGRDDIGLDTKSVEGFIPQLVVTYRLVDSTLASSFVAACCRVWVLRINSWIITSLAVSSVVAV